MLWSEVLVPLHWRIPGSLNKERVKVLIGGPYDDRVATKSDVEAVLVLKVQKRS